MISFTLVMVLEGRTRGTMSIVEINKLWHAVK